MGAVDLSESHVDTEEDIIDLEDYRNANMEFVGEITCWVRGLRFYDGEIHVGEMLTLTREPHNQYDSSAIRVDNIHGEKVGHISAAECKFLAEVMDDDGCRLEALASHEKGKFDMPMPVQCYAMGDSMWMCMEKLEQAARAGKYGKKVRVAKKPSVKIQAGKGTNSQASMDEMFKALRSKVESLQLTTTIPGICTELMTHQQSGVAWMLEQEARDPDGLPPLWKKVKEQGAIVYFNTVTNTTSDYKPSQLRGGVLADEMGLGKTIQVIGCCLGNPRPGRVIEVGSLKDLEKDEGDDAEFVDESSSSSKKAKKTDANAEAVTVFDVDDADAATTSDLSSKKCGGTLIVCPSSVINNWSEQLATHIQPSTVSVFVYTGTTRHVPNLADYDFIITSYNIVGREGTDYSAETEVNKEDNNKSSIQTESSDSKGKKTTKAKAKRKRSVAKGLTTIFDIDFHRIVLDEAHTIRNTKTQFYKGVHILSKKSTHQWCLTGTPLQNKIDDFYSYFSFLRFEPLSNLQIFRRMVSKPVERGSQQGADCLKASIFNAMLRRTKKELNLGKLAKKSYKTVKMDMPVKMRMNYDYIFQAAKSLFVALMKQDAVMKSYAQVLEILLRLRQCCCDELLVPRERYSAAKKVLEEINQRVNANEVDADAAPLPVEEAQALLKKLLSTVVGDDTKGKDNNNNISNIEDDDTAECVVCLDVISQDDARILKNCHHIFCNNCINQLVSDAGGRKCSCPLCRAPFSLQDALDFNKLKKDSTESDEVGDDMEVVAKDVNADGIELSESNEKITNLLKLLKSNAKKDDTVKSVIFSSFTSFLDIIEARLVEEKYTVTRIDGGMSLKKRIQAMKDLNSDATESPTIMLISLKAGGQGLNLTRASNVYMMDSWWNSAVEEQAFDRVHRIGQTRPVTIHKFVYVNSIEERILKIQEKKDTLAKGIVSLSNTAEIRLQNLGSLFDL